MPQRWAIRLAIDGDLRFCSHRDTVRVVERTALRAGLPLHYSQGFNPHPILSLPCPRPVGIATTCDLAVLSLDPPSGAINPEGLLQRLNRQAPKGMHFFAARPLEGRRTPQPQRVVYELPLGPDRADAVRRRIEELLDAPAWTVQRRGKPKRRRPAPARPFDLKPRVRRIEADDGTLRFELGPHETRWAKPAELLGLLGLDEQLDLARLVRTRIAFEGLD